MKSEEKIISSTGAEVLHEMEYTKVQDEFPVQATGILLDAVVTLWFSAEICAIHSQTAQRNYCVWRNMV